MGTSAAENIAIQVDASANTGALASAREDVTALGRAAKESSDGIAEGFRMADESTDRFATRLQASEEGVERSRGAARGLALEFSHLSMAAIEGEGSVMGIVRAVGLATTEMAEMSGVASLAAGASALGAIAVVVSTLIALFSTATEKNEQFNDSLSELSGKKSSVIEAEAEKELGRLKEVQKQIKENQDAMDNDRRQIAGNFGVDFGDIKDLRNRGKLLAEQVALQADLENRLPELHKMAIDKKEKEDEEAQHKAEQRAKEQERILEENARKASDLNARMSEEKQTALDKVAITEENAAVVRAQRMYNARLEEIRAMQVDENQKTQLILDAQKDRDDRMKEHGISAEAEQAIAKAAREEQRREQEIKALQVSEDEKTKLIVLAQEDRQAQISAIEKAARDKAAQEDKRKADEAAREAERAREQQVRSIEQSMDAGIRAHESYAEVATKTLLTPVEKYLESLAAQQLAEAAGDAASWNFVGAAEHAAASALALEGARMVAQLGGLNSGGGGGGAGSGGGGYGGGGSSLSPKDQQSGGNVTVVLQTVDPYSSSKINEVSYYLNRQGKLNRPIYVPPTTGLTTPAGG